MRLGGYSATDDSFRLPVTDSAMFIGQVPIICCDGELAFGGEFGKVIAYWQAFGSYTEFAIHVWQSTGVNIALVALERDEIVWGHIGAKGLEQLTDAIQTIPDRDIEGMKDFFVHCPILTRLVFVHAKGDSIVVSKIGRASERDYDFLNPMRTKSVL